MPPRAAARGKSATTAKPAFKAANPAAAKAASVKASTADSKKRKADAEPPVAAPSPIIAKKPKTRTAVNMRAPQPASDDDDIDAVADELENDDDEDDFAALTNAPPQPARGKAMKSKAAIKPTTVATKPNGKSKAGQSKQAVKAESEDEFGDDMPDDDEFDVGGAPFDDDNLDDEFDDDDDDEPQQSTKSSAAKSKSKTNSSLFALKKRSTDLFDDDNNSDTDTANQALDSDDDDNNWEQAELPIERKARMLTQEQNRVAEESAAELQTNISDSAQSFHLPTSDEIEAEKHTGIEPSSLMIRVQDVIGVLGNFTKAREAGRSRTEYLNQLKEDLASYFSYLPELIEQFLELFSPSECLEFLEANETQRPVTIRANSLKTKRRDLANVLINRGVNLDPIGEWTKVGLKVYDSQVPIGATPEYLAGHYMLQSAASFLPVMALAPQPGETVLDMAASPGGKSTYIAALMKNEGLLIANDLNTQRLKSLTGNLHRMGVKNSVVTNFDGRKMGKFVANHKIDRCLLDAPCSGLGVISHDPSIKLTKTIKDIQKCSHLQKELLLAAIDLLEVGTTGNSKGYIVYSTCSISVEENEDVVNYALQHRYVKLADTGLTFGVDGLTHYRGKRYHPTLKLTKRYYPHVHNMDGFFVAKLRKFQHGPRSAASSVDTGNQYSESYNHNVVDEDLDDAEMVDEDELEMEEPVVAEPPRAAKSVKSNAAAKPAAAAVAANGHAKSVETELKPQSAAKAAKQALKSVLAVIDDDEADEEAEVIVPAKSSLKKPSKSNGSTVATNQPATLTATKSTAAPASSAKKPMQANRASSKKK